MKTTKKSVIVITAVILAVIIAAGGITSICWHLSKVNSKAPQTQATPIVVDISPGSTLVVQSGSVLVVSCTALSGSTVTATFANETITLTENKSQQQGYSEFVGNFTTPENLAETKSFGAVTFNIASERGSTIVTGGEIFVETNTPKTQQETAGYPVGSEYKNVGNTHIIEVVHEQAETFSASDKSDISRPTNNYLPKGTVDYCSPKPKTIKAQGKKINLYTARYGKQLYETSPRNTQNTIIYKGTLPETNTVNSLGAKTVGHHTVMTFAVDWKAPFKFDIKPQDYLLDSSSSYIDVADRYYAIEEPTFNYIDITFCYASELGGKLNLAGNPVFSGAEIIKGDYDYVLRLHLKEKGVFYGWSAEYNQNGELEFWFLNPTKLEPANNDYGVSLNGITIVVDVGHGGADTGAYGLADNIHEKELNLNLALELEKQLTELGATVYMTRTDDSYIEVSDRIALVNRVKPDYVVSVHRNASDKSEDSGFSSFYFTPFSYTPALNMLEAVDKAQIFPTTEWTVVEWHYFFLCRVTNCPSVLTENGFVSNRNDYYSMQTSAQNQANAKAIIKGITDYLKTW